MYFSHRNFFYFVVWTTKDIAFVKIKGRSIAGKHSCLDTIDYDNISPRIVAG